MRPGATALARLGRGRLGGGRQLSGSAFLGPTLTRLMLFTTFHVMSIVHMRIDEADGLVEAYGAASTNVRDAKNALSPLVTQAYELLGMPGQNGLYGPIAALVNLTNDMSTEQRDVAWRVDWMKTVNAQDLDLDGRVEAVIPDKLEDALELVGLTAEQAEIAEDMINDGVSFNNAAVAAQAEDPETMLDALRLAELNAAIGNWSGSDNDPILDQLLRERRELLERLADRDPTARDVDPEILAITAQHDLSYGEALVAVTINNIDALTAQIDNWSGSDNDERLDEMIRLRDEQIAILAEGDPELAVLFRAGLFDGRTASEALSHIDVVSSIAESSELSLDEAEQLWAELAPQIGDLVEQGFSPEDATNAVFAANDRGLDIDAIAEFATDEGIGLLDAFGAHARADHLSMTIAEVDAFDGLNQHFPTFDNAKGGDTDGKVSLDDLQFVVDNPDRFDSAAVAAANALLASPVLLSRLDTGRDNNNVLNGGERFGDDEFDDRKISLDDISNFQWKQDINALVGTHFDEIDVVNGGEQDDFLSKADFQTFLEHNYDDLNDDEIAAFEAVIEAEFYDKDWLERNKGSITIAVAVVAGAVIAGASFGTLSGVSLALVTAAASATSGAVAGGVTTIGINAISDDSDWDDDLGSAMVNGALAGAAGGGLRIAAQSWGASSGLGKFAIGSGAVSDATAIVGMGGADWALDGVGFEVETIEGIRDFSNNASLVTGAAGLTAAAGNGARNYVNRKSADFLLGIRPGHDMFETVGSVSHAQAADFVGDHRKHLQPLFEATEDRLIAAGNALEPEDFANLDELVEIEIVERFVTGTTRPKWVTTDEPLVALVPLGEEISSTTPILRQSTFDALMQTRQDLPDVLSLPSHLHADAYQPVLLTPRDGKSTSVLAIDTAPTRELDGLITGQGGTEQIVIQDLSLYDFELKPAIARSNLITPIRETGSIGIAVADEAGLAPRVSSEPSALVDVFEPPTISLPTEQGGLSPVVEEFIRAGS